MRSQGGIFKWNCNLFRTAIQHTDRTSSVDFPSDWLLPTTTTKTKTKQQNKTGAVSTFSFSFLVSPQNGTAVFCSVFYEGPHKWPQNMAKVCLIKHRSLLNVDRGSARELVYVRLRATSKPENDQAHVCSGRMDSQLVMNWWKKKKKKKERDA